MSSDLSGQHGVGGAGAGAGSGPFGLARGPLGETWRRHHVFQTYFTSQGDSDTDNGAIQWLRKTLCWGSVQRLGRRKKGQL